MSADEGLPFGQGGGEGCDVAGVTAVAHGDGGVPLEALQLGALHGAAAEPFDVLLPAQAQQSGQIELASLIR